MEFLIAGLLVLNLGAVIVGARLIVRVSNRNWYETQRALLEWKRPLNEVNSSMAVLTHKLVEAEAQSKRVLERLNEMPGQRDLAHAVKRVEMMLEDSPAGLGPEREAAMSKAMEEGIASILAYTSGKAPGVDLRL